MIGKKLSPILEEIEFALWDFEANESMKPEFTEEGLRASIKIFMSVILDKMWELQEKEGMDKDTRINMAKEVGEKVRNIVKTYTNIDSHDLYTQFINNYKE